MRRKGKRPSIEVSYHAVAQLAERHPDAPVRDREEFIRSEVQAARRAGRVGKKCPGCGYAPKGIAGSPSWSIVWTKNARRCYVLRRTNSRVVVLTTMPPPKEQAA